MITFHDLKKLINERSTLEIISAIKSAIKYDAEKEKEKQSVSFELQFEDSPAQKPNHQRNKSLSEGQVFPDVTHSQIKVNESLELFVEIR